MSEQVNDRGKISTRRGPVSPKFVKEQQLQQQQQQQAQQASPVAMNEASAEPSPPTMKLPSDSGSKPTTSSIKGPAVREDPVASTPQAVVDRMFVRMVTCAALPIVSPSESHCHCLALLPYEEGGF